MTMRENIMVIRLFNMTELELGRGNNQQINTNKYLAYVVASYLTLKKNE